MKCETKNLKSARVGRFRVSLNMHTTESRDWESIVISHGKKVDGEWRNQSVICTPSDFIKLKEAIEKYDELGVGESFPSNSLVQDKSSTEVGA